jgi:LDH2 family malate/lactate/ureidoglycolate dehydrogenase
LTTGVAAVAIRGSNHCGALGYYTMLAVARDMIGIVTTNAMPTMAPWGGLDRIIGINPVAIGLPARDEAPFVLDTSFGSAARAKIVAFAEAGQPLPQGWAVDKFGQPTADARTALDGLITPIGGYKGTGLAMAVGILSTLLAGAAYGSQLGDLAHGASPGRDGQFVLVLNIAAFEDVDTFKSRVDEIIREIHGSRRTPGVDALRVPGEHAAATERSRTRQGIPLSKATFQGLVAAGHRLSVDVSQLQDATGRVNAS